MLKKTVKILLVPVTIFLFIGCESTVDKPLPTQEPTTQPTDSPENKPQTTTKITYKLMYDNEEYNGVIKYTNDELESATGQKEFWKLVSTLKEGNYQAEFSVAYISKDDNETIPEPTPTPIPELGQTKVKLSGQEITVTDFDDGYYASKGVGVDRSTYVKETDSVLKDTMTNLYWKNTENSLSHARAKKQCESISDLNKNWRLPTTLELAGLINFNAFPTVDPEVEPILFTRNAAVQVWASEISGTEEFYYYVNFKTGLNASQVNSEYLHTLCVSGTSPVSLFKKFNEYVIDEKRELMWQDGSGTKVRTSITWDESIAYCNTLNWAGYDDWRVPNMSEVFTILDYSRVTHQIKEFSVASRAMWSSTSLSSHPDENAYTAVEAYGNTQFKNKARDKRAVRCVRSVTK